MYMIFLKNGESIEHSDIILDASEMEDYFNDAIMYGYELENIIILNIDSLFEDHKEYCNRSKRMKEIYKDKNARSPKVTIDADGCLGQG